MIFALNLVCDECGCELFVGGRSNFDSYSQLELRINPCVNCIDIAENKGYEKAKNEKKLNIIKE